MPQPPKLTEIQKRRLKTLETQLLKAVREKDLQSGKIAVNDIHRVLTPTGHKTKLAQYKNWLFELAMEMGEYSFSERGLIGIRESISKNTRIHLEASALLAICYLRTGEYEKAKPLISEVLKNDQVIKSDRTRSIFKKNVIERFDEEVALFSIREERKPYFDVTEIQDEAGKLIATKNEEEIYKFLGNSIPQSSKMIMFDIDSFAKNQLTYQERKLLPSPQETIKDEKAGKTLFSSLKRVVYNSICDPKSEVYKAWSTNGLGAVLDKKYLTAAVLVSLAEMNIGLKALAISAVALIVRFTLDVFCDRFKPIGVMEARRQ